MRAVLDVNVIISAVLSSAGAPAHILRSWLQGDFELVVSPSLLRELRRALAYPKLRKRIEPRDAQRLLALLEGSATVAEDPRDPPPVRSSDPGDDYLIALAEAERAMLVSGDEHLLGLSKDLPIVSPRRFQTILGNG